MVLHVLRALFVLLMAAVGWFAIKHRAQPFGDYTWLALTLTLAVAVFFICIDILSPRRKLAIFSGTILGLLVGVFVAYGLSFVVDMVVDQYVTQIPEPNIAASKMEQQQYQNLKERRDTLIIFVNIVIGMVCVYLSISFILQTKDDFRFIVPYVEFAKQMRGARPILVDTSVIIDGRIVDIAETGILESRLIIPRFVLQELQTVADHGDKLKRNRGRRGLDALNKLQNNRKVEVILYDWTGHSSPDQAPAGADEKLLVLAKELHARLLTTDFNLSKVAQVRGVDVININDLATSLRAVVLPGERMHVKLIKAGEDPSQGIGFLDDGTMVVVEHGRSHLNEDVELTVTNVLQTASGRMIFGRLGSAVGGGGPAPEAVGSTPGASPGGGPRRRGRGDGHDA